MQGWAARPEIEEFLALGKSRPSILFWFCFQPWPSESIHRFGETLRFLDIFNIWRLWKHRSRGLQIDWVNTSPKIRVSNVDQIHIYIYIFLFYCDSTVWQALTITSLNFVARGISIKPKQAKSMLLICYHFSNGVERDQNLPSFTMIKHHQTHGVPFPVLIS